MLDAGTTSSAYFVMELVDGIPVSEYCQKHELGLQQRLSCSSPLARPSSMRIRRASSTATSSSSNILVTVYDGNPVPKVIDFGIVAKRCINR